MNSKIGLLAGLALVQIILIALAGLWPSANQAEDSQLLSFAAGDVSTIVISDGASKVEISKLDDTWQVAGLPADQDKVNNTLDKLAELSAPWPVASSASSAERFEVSEDKYQRRVRLSDGDEKNTFADLYLGTSPGYQRVHARRSDNDEIFSVALSNYELGLDADTWLDKGLIAMEDAPERISLVRVGAEQAGQDEMLVKGAEGWLYNEQAADQDVAQTYANRFTTLRVLGLVEDDAEATMLAKISASEGGQTGGQTDKKNKVYVISQVAEADEYVVSIEGEDGRFRLAAYSAEQLLMTDSDFAIKPSDPEVPDPGISGPEIPAPESIEREVDEFEEPVGEE